MNIVDIFNYVVMAFAFVVVFWGLHKISKATRPYDENNDCECPK